jgi:hypothetical protein
MVTEGGSGMLLREAEDTIYEALADITLVFEEEQGEEDQELRHMAHHVLVCLSARYILIDRMEQDARGGPGRT